LLCLTFRSLVLHVYRSFLIVHSRPMEYRFFSSMVKSLLLYTWFLTSKSHSDIKNANSLHRFHLITLSVFISLPIQYYQTLFSCAACLCAISGRLDFTSFFCIRPFSTSNPFLNWVLTYRPSLSVVLVYSLGHSLQCKILLPWRTHLPWTVGSYTCLLSSYNHNACLRVLRQLHFCCRSVPSYVREKISINLVNLLIS